jgi:hypothetical protein
MNKKQAIQEAITRWPEMTSLGNSVVAIRGRAPARTRYAVGRIRLGNRSTFLGYGETFEKAFEHADRIYKQNT